MYSTTLPRRPAARLHARAFTMIEVMLAGSLGIMVIFTAMSFFTTLERAKKFQAQRMESNTELATAHRVIQQAFRSLLMEENPVGREEDTKKRIEDDIKGALDHADERAEDDDSLPRFTLQPDRSAFNPDGRPAQVLELTVTTPPIHAVSLLSGAAQQEAYDLREMMKLRQKRLSIWDSSRASSASGSSSPSSVGSSKGSSASSSSSSKGGFDSSTTADRTAARADRLRAASVGLAGSEASADALAAAADRDTEAPRAPGLRGMFEVRPDPDQKTDPDNPGAGAALSLWWKQLPPEDDMGGIDPANPAASADRQLLELARRSSDAAPQIKILSNLKSARWRVYRRRQFVEKMSAKNAKELPAYVEFAFETNAGRSEKWLFEVAWSYGAEPGTIIATNDPLGAPLDSGDALAQINQAVNDAINGKKPNNTPGDPTSGPVASTGNGKGPGGGNSVPGNKTPGNTSQADIDAILRQFGFGR